MVGFFKLNMDRLKKILIRHEDLKLKPYVDTTGHLTIGVGRNLDEKGITKDEALYMLNNDVFEFAGELYKFNWFKVLNSERSEAIIDMAFNLGVDGILKFKKMIAALEIEDYETAAKEALDSKWSKQVGYRAKELAEIIRTGENKL